MRKESKNMKSMLHKFRLCFTITLFISLILVLERLTFDFLGFMFGMIIADVIHMIFIIIGLFGSYQYRANYIVACIVWSLLWIGWNLFVVSNYANFGILNRYDPIVLNLNTGKKSWWLVNSIGCSSSILSQNETTWSVNDAPISITLESIQATDNFIIKNCVIPFYWIEIVHSSILIALSALTMIFALFLVNAFNDEDDTFDYIGGFDPTIIPNFTNDHQLMQPNNAHIRLEPLYADNHHQMQHQINIFDAQTLRIK